MTERLSWRMCKLRVDFVDGNADTLGSGHH